MENKNDNRSVQTEKEQPGNLSSFNHRDEKRSTEAEEAKSKKKDESESFMDYNGNSEENAQAEK